uniref:Uncharacterized protein n=1 Tax=Geospiza parvula TaxID=87175 RepID=A0A8C3M7U6_GEOPR
MRTERGTQILNTGTPYYTYVIIGVTLGAALAIGFLAVLICMIKAKMIDSVFGANWVNVLKTPFTLTSQGHAVIVPAGRDASLPLTFLPLTQKQ